jgi:hypothetical protein
MQTHRGGARAGAGRKRKPSRLPLYPEALAAEIAIAKRLPELIEKLFVLADGQDRRALEFLVDRVLGRPVRRDEYVSDYAHMSDAELFEEVMRAHAGGAACGDGQSEEAGPQS